MTDRARLCAFGQLAEADFPLPGARADLPGTPQLSLTLVDAETLERRPVDMTEPVLWATRFDGLPFQVRSARDGSHRFSLGDRAAVLDADAHVLLCGPGSDTDPVWQRVLLDTVLYCCRLLAGETLLHAAAVEREAGAVAIAASSGAGKSSLTLALMQRGARLLSDDVVAMEPRGDRMLASAGPPLMNVPAAAPMPVGAEVLATFDDERWVQLPPEAHTPHPLALAAVVLLDRAGSQPPSLERLTATPTALLGHAIYFEHLSVAQRSRFDTFSRLVELVPVMRLCASPSVPPAELAEAVDDALREPQ